MISEIFGLLSSVDIVGSGVNRKFRVNLNKNRIRSISAYSSNSIFYFPLIITDQATQEEATMTARMIERVNASFVVACIGLMPFHRVKADDKAAIEDYLSQFHQNIGIDMGSGPLAQKAFRFLDTLPENVEKVPGLKDLYEYVCQMWDEAKRNNSDYVKLLAETVSVNEMYNISPVDDRTKVLQEQYMQKQEELATWGFIGEATDDMFDSLSLEDLESDDDYDDDDIDPDDYPDDAEDDLLSLLGESASFDKLYAKHEKRLNDKRFSAFGSATAIEDIVIASDIERLIKASESEDDIKKAKQIISRYHFGQNDDNMTKSIDRLIEKQRKKFGSVNEAAMKAAKRNKLSDDQFGLPSQRKFPLNDQKHVRLAVQMFKHCPEKDRPELARNIRKAADKFGMKIDTEGTASEYLSESSVKEAINSIKFQLEAVPANKIQSCKNLTKLASLEAKLKKLKNKYVKYLNRYKKKYNENKKSGSKSKLIIRFNKIAIGDPKAFMQQFGKYIKVINQRLKLCEERRAELRKRRGEEGSPANESIMFTLSESDLAVVDSCIQEIDEQLKSADAAIFTYEPVDDDVDDDNFESDPEYLTEATKMRSGHVILNPREVKDYDKTKRDLNNLRKSKSRAEQKQRERADREAESDDNIFIDYDRSTPAGGINPYLASDARHTEFSTFSKEIFTDMDMKKANDALPTMAKATIGFVIDETEEVVSRDVLIGVKSYIHKAPSMELISDIYNCVINKRKFLKFVKFITGEERSLADLVFGIKELRADALDARGGAGEWRSAFKRRRRWAKISVPYLMKEYTPNGTIVLTMNEVDFIKSEYGVDIMTPEHVRIIMDSDFLLSFVILDQANELIYVVYDGHGYGFQTYSYASMEREANQSDRAIRELYRAMAR